MDWQGVFDPIDDSSFGGPYAVAAALQTLFPGLSFGWSLSGAEVLAKIDAQGLNPPDAVRRVLSERSRYFCGTGETGGVKLSFNLGFGERCDRIWATLSGADAAVLDVVKALEAELRARSLSPEPLEVREFGEPSDSRRGATLFRSPPSARTKVPKAQDGSSGEEQ